MISFIRNLGLSIMLMAFIYRTKQWLSPLQIEHEDEVALEVIKKNLKRKSWFDATCCNWVSKSATTKILYILGMSVMSMTGGIIMGATLLYGIPAFFAGLILHNILRAHEVSRLNNTICAVEETAVLNQELKEQQVYFSESTQAMTHSLKQVDQCKEEIVGVTNTLESENQKLQANGKQLDAVTAAVIGTTNEFVGQQKKANDSLGDMANCVGQYHERIKAADKNLEKVSEDLADVARNLSKSSFLFHETVAAKEVQAQMFEEDQLFIEKLNNEMSDTDQLIERLKLQYGM